MDKRISWLSAVLILLLPLLFVPLDGRVIGSFDQLAEMSLNPKPAPDDQAWEVLHVDGALQFFGWRDLVFSSWRDGRVPGWNKHQFGGTPLLANSQSGALYPPHIAVGILRIPTGPAINLLAWLHLALAGFGALALARRIGSDCAGATLAAVTFELSPFLLGWTPLPSVISTSAWIPWALAFVIGVAQSARPIRCWSGLALSLAMMVLAGHLQFAAYGFMAVVLASIILSTTGWRTGNEDLKRCVLLVAPAIVLASMLASLHLVPVMKANAQGHRQATATKEGYQGYISTAIPAALSATLIAPSLTGWPGAYATEPSEPQPGVAAYWPSLVRRGLSFAEGAMGIGTVAFACLLAWRRSLASEPGVIAVSGVAVFGLLLALGTPLNALLYFGLPGWSATGSPGRAVVLFVLGATVLAGRCFSGITDRNDLKRPTIALTCAVLLSVVLPVTVLGNLPSWLGDSVSIQPLVSAAMLSSLPWLLLSGALAAATIWLASSPSRRLFAIGTAVAAQIVTMFGFRLPVGEPPAKQPTSLERVAFVSDQWSMMERAPGLMPPNMATLFGQSDIAGYDSLINRGTVEMMREINGGQDPAPMANGNMMLVKPGADVDALRQAGVSRAYSRTPLLGIQPTETTDAGVFITDVEGRLIEPNPDPNTEIRYESGHILFTSAAPSVTVRERNLPGWRAAIDGKPAAIPPGRWITLDLAGEAGPKIVRLTYDPWDGQGTILASITGIAFVILALPLFAFRRRTPPEPTGEPDVE